MRFLNHIILATFVIGLALSGCVEQEDQGVDACEEDVDFLEEEILKNNEAHYLEVLELQREIKGLSTALAECRSGGVE